MDTRQKIVNLIAAILARKDIACAAPDDGISLYQDGLGLDSLDTAELSAALEQSFGTDPYTRGRFVRTLGELVAYYHGAAQQE